MSTGESESPGPEHPETTQRRHLRHFFYTKHHRSGVSEDAQWCIGPDDEFAVFDEADWHDLSNAKGDLHGVLKRDDGRFEILGTRDTLRSETC